MKNKFIYFIICLFISSYINGQNVNVSDKYKLLAMLSLFSEGLNMEGVEISKENLLRFLSENVEIKEIKQNSFKKFIFLSINTNFKSKYADKGMPVIWTNKNCKGYILAINTDSYYTFKLRGYQINDFHSFLRYMEKYHYKNIKNVRVFVKKYRVEGLDFECLYKSVKVRDIDKLKSFPCLDNTCLKLITTHSNN